MKRSAHISADGRYRYTLTRDWSLPHEPIRTVVFVGLNPSTADAELDDPTIRRCIGFAKAWGYNRLVMVNLFAFRATQPSVMKRQLYPHGSENNSWLISTAREADLIVGAWGGHGTFKGRADTVRNMYKDLEVITNRKLHHLGLTKDGQPKHPLYLRADIQPQPFED